MNDGGPHIVVPVRTLMRVLVFMFVMPMVVPLIVIVPMVVIIAAQKPRARDIDREPEARNRNGFREMDRHGREDAADGFIADQNGDHRKDDGAREAREVAELAGAESEPRILRVPARIAV